MVKRKAFVHVKEKLADFEMVPIFNPFVKSPILKKTKNKIKTKKMNKKKNKKRKKKKISGVSSGL